MSSKLILLLASLLAPCALWAETVVPITTIRPNTILTLQDLKVENISVSGGFSNPADIAGMEARVVLYAGRPILRDSVAPPAIVNRNEIVKLVYSRGALEIVTAGRALDRGSVNELIRVMNLNSRTMVVGRVTKNGYISIGGGAGDLEN